MRNVLLVSVDTLRADHLRLYGYTRRTTPAIDEWFSKSTVFERAYAPEASTTPSVICFLTGQRPQHHGVRFLYQKVPPKLPTVASRLHLIDYQTAAVFSNMVLTREATGLDAQFDYYDDFVNTKEPYRPVYERGARETTDAALVRLTKKRNAGKPFFLWVHYMDPHGPYLPPASKPSNFTHETLRPIDVTRLKPYLRYPGVDDGNEYVDLYDEEIAYTDREVGRLLSAYDDLGLSADSLVIFTADHGESMMEHETWFSHGHHVYDEVTRVPLMIKGFGFGAARVPKPVSVKDVAPTILHAAAIPSRKERPSCV